MVGVGGGFWVGIRIGIRDGVWNGLGGLGKSGCFIYIYILLMTEMNLVRYLYNYSVPLIASVSPTHLYPTAYQRKYNILYPVVSLPPSLSSFLPLPFPLILYPSPLSDYPSPPQPGMQKSIISPMPREKERERALIYSSLPRLFAPSHPKRSHPTPSAM